MLVKISHMKLDQFIMEIKIKKRNLWKCFNQKKLKNLKDEGIETTVSNSLD